MKYFLIILFILFISQKSLAYDLEQLELKVWISPSKDLNGIEKELMAELQKTPSDPFIFYLLSHVYIRRFIDPKNSQNITSIYKALELGQEAISLAPKSDFGYIAVLMCLNILDQPDQIKELRLKNFEKTWRYTLYELQSIPIKERIPKVLSLLEAVNHDLVVIYLIENLKEVSDLKPFLSLREKLHNPYFDSFIADYYFSNADYLTAIKFYDQAIPLLIDPTYAQKNKLLSNIALNKPWALEAPLVDELLPRITSLEDEDSFLELSLIKLKIDLEKKELINAKNFVLLTLKNVDSKSLWLENALPFFYEKSLHLELEWILSEILNLNNQEPHIMALCAETYLNILKDAGKAIFYFNASITFEPMNHAYFNGLGVAYLTNGQATEALVAFKQSVELNPDDAYAQYNLACAFSRLNLLEDSIAALKISFLLNPDLKKEAMKDKDLDGVKKLLSFI